MIVNAQACSHTIGVVKSCFTCSMPKFHASLELQLIGIPLSPLPKGLVWMHMRMCTHT